MPDKVEMEILNHKVSLTTLVNNYIKGLSREVFRSEVYYNLAKGEVLLELTVRKQPVITQEDMDNFMKA